MKKPLYKALASAVQARHNCEKSGNKEWFDRHTDRINELVREHMPCGGGFDSGTTFYFGAASLAFNTSFHHMTEGYYDGWTEHTVRVYPSLVSDFTLTISGENRDEIKEYIAEAFDQALRTEIDE